MPRVEKPRTAKPGAARGAKATSAAGAAKGGAAKGAAAPTRRIPSTATPSTAVSLEERMARLDRAIAVATRGFAASVRSRTSFEAVLVRGEPVRHWVHLVRLVLIAAVAAAVILAFSVGGAVLEAVLLVPVGYGVYWLYLALTAGEQIERISVDEDGRIVSVRAGHDADLRGDVLKIAIPAVVIVASAWIAIGLIHDIAVPPMPHCDLPSAVRDNDFCAFIPGMGGGTALTVGQAIAVSRAVRVFQLLYTAVALIGSIWFLRRMLTGRWVVDVRPVRRLGGTRIFGR